jgi:hypothetical protein
MSFSNTFFEELLLLFRMANVAQQRLHATNYARRSLLCDGIDFRLDAKSILFGHLGQ